MIVVDVDEGCALIRVRTNTNQLPESFLTKELSYKRDFIGHENDLLQLSTIPVCDLDVSFACRGLPLPL